jgi:hypothetical protein
LTNPDGRGSASRCSRTDDDVGRGQIVLSLPERFANYATKSVPGDGISDHFGADRQSEPGSAEGIGGNGDGEHGITQPSTPTVGVLEIGFAQHPASSRESPPRR